MVVRSPNETAFGTQAYQPGVVGVEVEYVGALIAVPRCSFLLRF